MSTSISRGSRCLARPSPRKTIYLKKPKQHYLIRGQFYYTFHKERSNRQSHDTTLPRKDALDRGTILFNRHVGKQQITSPVSVSQEARVQSLIVTVVYQVSIHIPIHVVDDKCDCVTNERDVCSHLYPELICPLMHVHARTNTRSFSILLINCQLQKQYASHCKGH